MNETHVQNRIYSDIYNALKELTMRGVNIRFQENEKERLSPFSENPRSSPIECNIHLGFGLERGEKEIGPTTAEHFLIDNLCRCFYQNRIKPAIREILQKEKKRWPDYKLRMMCISKPFVDIRSIDVFPDSRLTAYIVIKIYIVSCKLDKYTFLYGGT